jgi:hypothetical protein
MKKNFLLVVALVASTLAGFATDNKTTDNNSRRWNIDENFTSIAAKGNVEVVLISNGARYVNFEGSEKQVNAVHLNVEKGVLTITGSKGCSEKNRIIVYVPIQELHNVTLKGGSNLSSKGRIQSDKLKIRVEGLSKVNVRNIGDIVIESDDHHQFNYEKSERSIIRIEKA